MVSLRSLVSGRPSPEMLFQRADVLQGQKLRALPTRVNSDIHTLKKTSSGYSVREEGKLEYILSLSVFEKEVEL